MSRRSPTRGRGPSTQTPKPPTRQRRRKPAPGRRQDSGLRLPAISGRTAWLLGVGALVIVVIVVAVIASSGSGESPPSFTGSGDSNFNLANTRDLGGPIDSSTVSRLRQAWTLPITTKSEYGSYSSTPIVSDGVIYSQDLSSNVQAIDLKTGRVLWTHSYESPDQGPNGLVVADGRVFGATATAAFALEEKTGRQLWMVPLVRNEHEGIDMAPGYQNGVVYVATVPGNNEKFYGGGGVGILWALQASTGRKLWHFDTAPESLWGHPEINSGGGVWYSPAFAGGSIYFGTGNPAPFPGTSQYPWGSSRPGPNLYTDSLVKLDAATGRLQWYYQQTPHDLYDHDLQDPPMLVQAGGRQLVVAAGKGGFVIALDRQTGRVVWKQSVGIHNGHDDDGLYAMRHEYAKLKMPESVYPGLLGGVIAPMATDGSTIFAPVVNLPVNYTSQTENTEGPAEAGELVALDAATGAVRWAHKFSTPVFGAATVVNDLVFATTFSGELVALSTATGAVEWQTQLPAGTNTGVAVSGDTLIAPAGFAGTSGQQPQLVAYRLGG